MLLLARSVASTGKCGAEEVSPFCLDAMYRSGIFYARQHSQTAEPSSLEALMDIKTGLRAVSERWKAAGWSAFSFMAESHKLTLCRTLSLDA